MSCPFCNLEGERKIIMSDYFYVAFLDEYPVSPGRTLIIPKIHESNFFNLPETWQDALIYDVNCVKRILDEKYRWQVGKVATVRNFRLVETYQPYCLLVVSISY